MRLPAGFIVMLVLCLSAASIYAGTRSTDTPVTEVAGTTDQSPVLTFAPVETPGSQVQIQRIRAPLIDVDASMEILGIENSGAMETPTRPEVVAWYNFSQRPGRAGNIVVSGHLDFRGWGPAVFWRLREVTLGQPVELFMEDGSVFIYRVTDRVEYRTEEAPVAEIVGPTGVETLTLITCAGRFDQATGSYDRVLVVRAVRN